MTRIFNKELNIKDYYCSRGSEYIKIIGKPRINLYIQVTPYCPARCDFCDTCNSCVSFDISKLRVIIGELKKEVEIGKVSLTGGEPLHCFDITKDIIKIGKEYNQMLNLNTNAYYFDDLKSVYKDVHKIVISKHHYDNEKNDKIMNVKTPDIYTLNEVDDDRKMIINCVLQKGYIDTYEEVIKMLEGVADAGFKKINFISLIPLTKEAKEKYVNPNLIIESCKQFLNDGMLYDHDMCNCFEFMVTIQYKNNKSA